MLAGASWPPWAGLCPSTINGHTHLLQDTVWSHLLAGVPPWNRQSRWRDGHALVWWCFFQQTRWQGPLNSKGAGNSVRFRLLLWVTALHLVSSAKLLESRCRLLARSASPVVPHGDLHTRRLEVLNGRMHSWDIYKEISTKRHCNHHVQTVRIFWLYNQNWG